MSRTQHTTEQQARSRGTEGGVVLVLVAGGLVAAVAFVASEIVRLLGGISHALP